MTQSRMWADWRYSIWMFVIAGLMVVTVVAGAIAAPIDAIGSGVPPTAGNESAIANASQATPVVSLPVDNGGCDELAPGVDSEAWIRIELYFGTTKPDGTELTDEEWQAFLDEEITPHFPAGLTVLEGYGQFLNSSGVIAQEGSIVLIIFLPFDAIEESSASIEEIRDAYEVAFDQESVLRADSAPVCISF